MERQRQRKDLWTQWAREEAGTTGAVAPAHPRGETRQVRSCCTGNLSGPQDNLEGGEAREVRVEK